MTNTTLHFADGSSRVVPSRIAHDVVGLDRDGDLLYSFCGAYAPLTPCCFADGKGSDVETGVVCRSCYRVVDFKFGCNVPKIAVSLI
jgi:hypothetical protein